MATMRTDSGKDKVLLASVDERLHRSLRDVLFRNAYTGTAAGFAALVGLYLIRWDQELHYVRDWWCLALLFCLLGRSIAVALQWQQRSTAPDSLSEIPYYLYYALSVVEGIVWGSSMFTIFPSAPLEQAFLLIVLIAIAVGGMATFTGAMSLYAIYVTTIVGMSFAKLITIQETPYQILAWLCWALLMVLLVVARHMNTIFANMIRLSLKNEQMVLIESASKQSIVDFSEKLSAKTTEVEHVTAQLKGLVRILSHDLRTHLVSLCQSSRLLSDDKGSVEQRAFIIDTLQKSAESGLQLVDDIIEITGVGPMVVSVDLTEGSIQQISDKAMKRVKDLAESKGVQVHLAVDERRPVKVDIRRIEDVLATLMETAVKHTPPDGSVTVQTTPTPAGLRVEVIDTGVTLAPTQVSELFEQPASEEGHGQGGSLALIQDIVKAHNSRIEVTANAVAGSCYSFVLPWGDGRAKAQFRRLKAE